MKFRRKKKQREYPAMPATPLEDNAALQEIRALPDEALEAELAVCTNTEGWFRSTAAAFTETGPPELAFLHERAAAHARLAREVIATTLVMRQQERDGGSKQEGYL